MKDRRQRRAAQGGQALLETVIGLIGLVVALAGLFQIASTGDAYVRNYIDARTEAERNAVNGNLLGAEQSYVGGWSNGPDGLAYTADDSVSNQLGGTLRPWTSEAEQPVDYRQLASTGIVDQFGGVFGSDSLAAAAGLFRGESERQVAVQPALRAFVVNLTTITLRDSAVMPALAIEP